MNDHFANLKILAQSYDEVAAYTWVGEQLLKRIHADQPPTPRDPWHDYCLGQMTEQEFAARHKLNRHLIRNRFHILNAMSDIEVMETIAALTDEELAPVKTRERSFTEASIAAFDTFVAYIMSND